MRIFTRKSSRGKMSKPLGEVLKLSAKYLEEKGIERSRRSAEDLLSSLLCMKRIDLYMHFDLPLEEKELASYRTLIKRKVLGEPLEYILGEVAFAGCSFVVNRHALIPRPETEILFDLAASLLEKEDLVNKKAWDLCTGSGVLGISLKKRFPQLDVVLSDLSQEAIGLALENGKKNAVEVSCRQGDFLQPFLGERADIVFCNPPYVSKREYAELGRGVRDFEPEMALVGGEDGLFFYEKLAKELPSFLKPKAKIFLEIGFMQGESVLALFSAPYWKKKWIRKDYSEKDRFFFLEFE